MDKLDLKITEHQFLSPILVPEAQHTITGFTPLMAMFLPWVRIPPYQWISTLALIPITDKRPLIPHSLWGLITLHCIDNSGGFFMLD